MDRRSFFALLFAPLIARFFPKPEPLALTECIDTDFAALTCDVLDRMLYNHYGAVQYSQSITVGDPTKEDYQICEIVIARIKRAEQRLLAACPRAFEES